MMMSTGSCVYCFWKKHFVWPSATLVIATSHASSSSSWDRCLWIQVRISFMMIAQVWIPQPVLSPAVNPLFVPSSSPVSPVCPRVSFGPDEEGVVVTLDRFDPGRDQAGASGQVPSALLPGDVLVPCLFSSQPETTPDSVVQSEAEIHQCFKVMT